MSYIFVPNTYLGDMYRLILRNVTIIKYITRIPKKNISNIVAQRKHDTEK